MANNLDWKLHQLDVNNTFLCGNLSVQGAINGVYYAGEIICKLNKQSMALSIAQEYGFTSPNRLLVQQVFGVARENT